MYWGMNALTKGFLLLLFLCKRYMIEILETIDYYLYRNCVLNIKYQLSNFFLINDLFCSIILSEIMLFEEMCPRIQSL